MLLTIKQVAKQCSICEGTVRAWTLKPIEGQPYNPSVINYENLYEKLHSYYPNDSFKQTFGYEIEELEIFKQPKTKNKYFDCKQLRDCERGVQFIMHNYSLKTLLMFLKYDDDTQLYLFYADINDYRAYTIEQLTKDNIKLEIVEQSAD